ncbi:MAG: undecaprenyl-diphosphate phosphatase [Pseudomonadota bacterium]
MPLIQLLVLALVQGITEFLPISSSAHLILAPTVVDSWSDQGPVIDVAAHVGSLGAVLIYFHRETRMLAAGGIHTLTQKATPARTLFLRLVAASLPLLAVGFILGITGLVDQLRNPLVIGVASIVFAIVLWFSDRSTVNRTKTIDKLTTGDAMCVGVAQMLALIPGASRSGVTMTAARYLGWSREEAARFSMLLAIPSILALGMFAGLDLITGRTDTASPLAAFVVAVLSFIAALLAIHVFLTLTRRISYTPFVIYRIIMGAALIVFALR